MWDPELSKTPILSSEYQHGPWHDQQSELGLGFWNSEMEHGYNRVS